MDKFHIDIDYGLRRTLLTGGVVFAPPPFPIISEIKYRSERGGAVQCVQIQKIGWESEPNRENFYNLQK